MLLLLLLLLLGDVVSSLAPLGCPVSTHSK